MLGIVFFDVMQNKNKTGHLFISLFFIYNVFFSVFAKGQVNVLESGIDKLNLSNCVIQSGAIQIIGNGNFISRRAYFPSETTLDEIDEIFDVKVYRFDVNGLFRIGIGKQSAIAGTLVEFTGNDTSSSVKVYKMNNTTLTFIKKYDLPFIIDTSSVYTIKVGKRVRNLIIEISSDNEYYYNDSLSYPTPFFGSLWGRPFIACNTGEIEVSNFMLCTPLNISPKVSVWGDSFIEGNSLDEVEDRYVSLIKDSIGYQNISIMGRGGENSSSIVSRFSKETEWFANSKYALLAIGVNDNNFTIWKTNMENHIDTLKKRNIIPIIATLTPRSDRLSFISQANNWIRNNYNGAYVDLNKAISANGVTWDSAMVMTDNIHPTPLGHLKMLERIRLEAPYIFRNSDVITVDYINETTFENIPDSVKYSFNSNFISFNIGSNTTLPLLPETTIYFKDTSNYTFYNSLYDILHVPKRPEAPTNPSTNSSFGFYDWVYNPSFTSITDYEYSLDYGSSWITCFEKPIYNPLLTEVQIRVKATSTNFKGEILQLYDSTILSTSTISVVDEINIFPNPNNGIFNVSNKNNNESKNETIVIYNTLGEIVYTTIINEKKTEIRLTELPSGIYILQMQSKNGVVSKKFVKE